MVFSAGARRTGLNKIVEFNSSPTRGTVFALGCRTQSVPKSLMRELLHSSLPDCLAESWAGCLRLIAVRRAHSRPALPRNSHGLHCFDFGLLIHWPLQLQWTAFWTTASYIFVYNFMQQHCSSQWSVLVFEEAFPENCFGKSTQGGANGLEKPLDEEHHGVHQQRLS